MIDGDYTTKQPDGLPRWIETTPDNQRVVFEQDFWIFAANYTPADIMGAGVQSASPLPTGYYLAAEKTEPIGDGTILRLTQTYAKKPSDYDVWESHAMSFIQFITSAGVQRLSANFTVPSRIEHKFYLVLNSGGDATNVNLIPRIEKWFPTISVSGHTSLCTIAYSATTPTGDAYVASVIGTEIVAEDCEIAQWRGPIYVRMTRYVKAR